MPNAFAYFVLFFWPVVVFVLFRTRRISLALSWAVVAGYLLLPLQTGFDLPMFPTIEKNFVLSVSAAVMCLVALRWSRDRQRILAHRAEGMTARVRSADPATAGLDIRRGQWLFLVLVVLLFATPFLTVAQNGETIIIGTTVLRGLKSYDALNVIGSLLVATIPFLLGRRFLASEEGQRDLLKVLALAAVAYSVFILYEARMSPQLNRMIYGFFPHSFAQHMRGDGFRPVVFLNHGLWLAIFVCLSVLSAFVLWKDTRDRSVRAKWLLSGIWLILMLVLCKSMGALALAVLFVPAVLFLRPKGQILLAAAVAGTVLLYPALRGAGWIPTGAVHELAASVNESRAASLKTRLDNEDMLLAKAQQKPLAGWGGWGRPRVYNERGHDVSITDGYWVIVIGVYGWLGYVAQFGLMCLPLLIFGLRRNRLEVSVISAGVGIVLAVSLIDQIPNASMGPVVWLLAGSVMGRYQTSERVSKKDTVRNRNMDVSSPAESAVLEPPPAGNISDVARPPRHQRRPRQPV